MNLQIVKPTPSRNMFLLVQIATGSLILLIVYLLYFHNPYFISFITDSSRAAIKLILIGLFGLLCIDSLAKYIFVVKLPVTKLSLIFVYTFMTWGFLKGWLTGDKRAKYESMSAATKTAFLSVVVKVFFLPIMLNILTLNASNFLADMGKIVDGTLTITFDNAFAILTGLLFAIDTGIFAFGYTVEAGWLRSTIRSVEPTLLGWVVALITYPPVNGITGQFLPLVQTGYTGIAQHEVLLRAGQILLLCCYSLFVICSISLGTKASNLTNRGIVDWGPYRFVRHPAYTAKLLGFFIEGLLFAGSTGYFLAWVGFAFIYALRAYTEERHLSQDPDYIAYKQKVRWKVIPGIF